MGSVLACDGMGAPAGLSVVSAAVPVAADDVRPANSSFISRDASFEPGRRRAPAIVGRGKDREREYTENIDNRRPVSL